MTTPQDLKLICADLSMNRPGFALLHYTAPDTITVERMSNINNHGLTGKRRKCHGQILSEIAHELRSYLEREPKAILVREEALAMVYRSAKTIQTLHKVVGVSDLYGWGFEQRQFEEINPKTVKAILTGDPNAEKQIVADALATYVGEQQYECDDESDAVAVGVAWLIKNGYIEKRQRDETKKARED